MSASASPLTVRAILLQLLSETDDYSLGLIERMRARAGGHVTIELRDVYSYLRGFEREGLVTAYEADAVPERGMRTKRFYVLTHEGRDVVQWARSFVRVALGL